MASRLGHISTWNLLMWRLMYARTVRPHCRRGDNVVDMT